MKTSALLLPFLAAALSLVPSAHAHGFVANFGVDGKVYKGNIPSGRTDPSPIRQITDQSPIYGATSPTVNCGTGAPNAALVVDAMPGSNLTWDWRTASLGNWPHNTGTFSISAPCPVHVFDRIVCTPSGPMLTYLASCGSTTCDQFDSRTAKWFKIDQVGKDSSGTWVQQQISQFLHSPHTRSISFRYTVDGNVYSTNLPENLAPGEYLVRHEIIALHLATEKGKAEFYPSCQQIKVGGSGTGVPSQDQLVLFPGAYSDDDPGIFDPQVRFTPANPLIRLTGIYRSSTPAPRIPSLVDPSPRLSLPAVETATVRARTSHRALASRSRRPRTRSHPLSPQTPETRRRATPRIAR
jgi:hypothetical protein